MKITILFLCIFQIIFIISSAFMSKLYIHIPILSIICTASFLKSCMVFPLFIDNLYVLIGTSAILCTFFEHSCTIVHILTKNTKNCTFFVYNAKKALHPVLSNRCKAFLQMYQSTVLLQNFIQKCFNGIAVAIRICQTGFSMPCAFD